jgi:hypothetical protein
LLFVRAYTTECFGGKNIHSWQTTRALIYQIDNLLVLGNSTNCSIDQFVHRYRAAVVNATMLYVHVHHRQQHPIDNNHGIIDFVQIHTLVGYLIMVLYGVINRAPYVA